MARVWKVQETNTVGTVKLCSTINGSHLLVNPSDPTFAPGTTIETALVADGNGNYCANIDLADASFFTFGYEQFAPGCVATNTLWLKANTGVVVSGTAVTIWGNGA